MTDRVTRAHAKRVRWRAHGRACSACDYLRDVARCDVGRALLVELDEANAALRRRG